MACRSWSWAIFLCDKLKTVKDEQGLPHRLFPKTEAEERVGRHVEALRLCGEIPLKTRGKFVLTDKTSDGYEVAIEWELVNGSVPARPRRTWIGKVEYEETLIEFTVDGYPHRKTIYFLYGCGLWRKASMERRNSPTDINYFPELNSNLPFLTSDMKGLQIKEPLQSAGQENLMVFNFSTHGYKDIVFSFAAINELTNATAILVDYSTVAGTPVWTTSGMISNSFALGSTYALYNIDFSSISAAENNPNFKIRLRFTGTNMTADTGARITFNNIAVHGTALPLAVNQAVQDQFSVFPNPFTDQINVIGVAQTQEVTYEVYSIDGRIIKAGKLDNAQAYLADIPSGIYLLQLHSEGKSETKKIIKK